MVYFSSSSVIPYVCSDTLHATCSHLDVPCRSLVPVRIGQCLPPPTATEPLTNPRHVLYAMFTLRLPRDVAQTSSLSLVPCHVSHARQAELQIHHMLV